MDSRSIDHSGAEARRLYIDAIDEAKQKRERDGKKHRGPRAPRRRIVDISIRQLRIVESQQRMLARAERLARDDRSISPEAVQAIVRLSRDITDQIGKLGTSIREAAEAEAKRMRLLSPADFDDVLRLHLVRVARDLPEHDKRIVLATWFGEDVAEAILSVAVNR